MYKKIYLEIYDVEGYITGGKSGLIKYREYMIPKDLSLMDLMDDLTDRFDEKLDNPETFVNSIFIYLSKDRSKTDKSMLVIKQNSSSDNATVFKMNEVVIYLDSNFSNVTV